MNKVIRRSGILMILALVLAAGMLVFVLEYLIQAEKWVMFPGSPHVYGTSDTGSLVTDRDGILILNTADGRQYSENEALRKATIHWVGDRIGNISAPALSTYATQIVHYDLFNGVYTYGGNGAVVELTLSAKVQIAALEAMGDYKGTVAVYNYKTGEILCAVTTPCYDPDNVPDIGSDTTGTWTGAYMNRFTQSVYTPGSIFKIVTAAAALETIPDIMEQTFTCNGEIVYNEQAGDKVTCMDYHGEIGFQEAFMRSCNCAFAQIADQLGGETLQRYAAQFGITGRLTFDGITTAAGSVDAQNAADVLVAWSAIGQHKDQINPCTYLNFIGAIASGGSGVQPYLVSQISGDGWTTHTAEAVSTGRLMSSETAAVMQRLMRNNVENYYGDDHFGGLSVCAKSGTAEVGGDRKPNAMFTGFVTDEEYPLAFIVAVEDAGYGRQVCIPILSRVLSACVEQMGGAT